MPSDFRTEIAAVSNNESTTKHIMNGKYKIALPAVGFFAAAVLAFTATQASAANLLAYYPLDSFWYSGGSSGIPYTQNSAPGSTWGNASLDYSGGLLYGNTIDSAGGVLDGCYRQDGTIGGTGTGAGRITFGAWDPLAAATSSFTYALWMYTPVGFSGNGQFILSKFAANSATGLEFKLLFRPTGDFQLMTWGGSAVNTEQTVAAANAQGQWNHIAVTASKASGQVTWGMYLNGNPLGWASGFDGIGNISGSAGGQAMNLGMPNFANLNFAPNGVKADEIYFYDGILSQSEIQGLITMVPEPSAITMLALGGGLLLLIRRRS
jgi:hypothetical protein